MSANTIKAIRTIYMYSKKKFIYKLTEQLKKTITKNHNLKCALIYIYSK